MPFMLLNIALGGTCAARHTASRKHSTSAYPAYDATKNMVTIYMTVKIIFSLGSSL